MPRSPADIIRECIERSMRYRDGRGARWAEHDCARALGDSAIDQKAAAAARQLGEWLRGAGR